MVSLCVSIACLSLTAACEARLGSDESFMDTSIENTSMFGSRSTALSPSRRTIDDGPLPISPLLRSRRYLGGPSPRMGPSDMERGIDDVSQVLYPEQLGGPASRISARHAGRVSQSQGVGVSGEVFVQDQHGGFHNRMQSSGGFRRQVSQASLPSQMSTMDTAVSGTGHSDLETAETGSWYSANPGAGMA